MDIEAWLETLGLGQYARAFAENDVDFTILDQLTDADLKELGVASLGHRKRLLGAIAARAPMPRLRRHGPSPRRRASGARSRSCSPISPDLWHCPNRSTPRNCAT
jgi:hypothetical protein